MYQRVHPAFIVDSADVPTILTASLGRLFGPVGTFSILRRVSIPSMTRPNTTCFPSRKSHFAVVMKNWHPFVLGPEFAW